MEADEGRRVVERVEAQSCDFVGCSDVPEFLARKRRSSCVADVVG